MELFSLVLIILACVMFTSVLDQLIPHLSLPLIQIAAGLIVALIYPPLGGVNIDSELFLVLFIAPLLYRDSREVSRVTLWNNKWSILSMAIPLVIATVVATGFVLHQIIPSIQLAAAFACAAALGPTDAAAVSAMGSTIHLSERQSILLSGEALINDASGVVSFQFAIAAALTGAFSAKEATASFGVLFFGGIALGMAVGYVLKHGMNRLRGIGLVNTTTHVLYEVLTPFLLFLFAEELHVSGILAVVAAGLMMQEIEGNIKSPERARQQMVSNSFWEVIIYLINGFLFVMLGMQLPKVMETRLIENLSAQTVIGTVIAVTSVIIAVRFLWVGATELMTRDRITGERGIAHVGSTLRQALVTTLAGPKGAVTLSIILTLPVTMNDGSPLPMRSQIIFITSGVILCTLLLANFLLPMISPKEERKEDEVALSQARILVLEKTVKEMRDLLDTYADEDFTPAFRLTLMRYRVRLMRERLSMESCGRQLGDMIMKVLDVQQARADEIQREATHIPESQRLDYYSILPAIRRSIGYFAGAENVGARFETSKGRLMLKLLGWKRRVMDYDDEKKARVYFDTVVFALDLEYTAIRYLQGICREEDPERARLAGVLLEEHKAALQSLWGRINYGQEVKLEEVDVFVHTMGQSLPEGMLNRTMEQFRKAFAFNNEADANAMQIEMEKIRECRRDGSITEEQSWRLREEVYLMQTALLE